jgi:hypothetical protein
MLSFDDCELATPMAAAADLPIEGRERFLCDVAAAVAVTRTGDIAAMIERLRKAHMAAADFCLDGDCWERHQGVG